MQRGEGHGFANGLDSGRGVANGLDRERVDIIVDGVDKILVRDVHTHSYPRHKQGQESTKLTTRILQQLQLEHEPTAAMTTAITK